MPARLIMRPPSPALTRALSTHPERDRINPVRAAGQHARFVAALVTAGVDVHLLPADPDLADACFTSDVVLAFARRGEDAGTALLVACRPGAPSRRAEVAPAIRCARQVLRDDVEVIEIAAPGTLDGGDVIVYGDRVAIGISARTNEDGARSLARAVQSVGYRAYLCPVEDRLHLASAVTVLRDDRLIGTAAGFASLDAAGPEVAPDGEVDRIVIADEDVEAANVLAVAGRCFVVRGHPRAVALMHHAGEDVVEVELDEFVRADGGPTCLAALIP